MCKISAAGIEALLHPEILEHPGRHTFGLLEAKLFVWHVRLDGWLPVKYFIKAARLSKVCAVSFGAFVL